MIYREVWVITFTFLAAAAAVSCLMSPFVLSTISAFRVGSLIANIRQELEVLELYFSISDVASWWLLIILEPALLEAIPLFAHKLNTSRFMGDQLPGRQPNCSEAF